MRLANRFAVRFSCLASAGAALVLSVSPLHAQDIPVSLRDSFPIGDSDGALCQVQNRADDAANISPFDRSWAVVCRDSARPVGYIFALRSVAGDPAARLEARRAEEVDCSSGTSSPSPMVTGGTQRTCALRGSNLDYQVVRADRGKISYFAEGFSAYESAIELALKSVIEDEVARGTISVATTSVADSAAFARIQALSLEPDQALAEGYRRNNSGDYADAAEFFETLQQRVASSNEDIDLQPAEFVMNRALQKSNLGKFKEADRLFAEARDEGINTPVQERLLRNFEGIHLINQGKFAAAIDRLNQPVQPAYSGAEKLRESGEITVPVATRINASGEVNGVLGFEDDLKLTEEERIAIIDAQAKHLVATANRLSGNYAEARGLLAEALSEVVEIREGRVVSVIRLRAQILTELAQIEESQGDFGAAEGLYQGAIDILQIQYPQARSVNAAKARYASYLKRRGRTDEAQRIYKEVVESALERRNPVSGMANQISPYFELLASSIDTNPGYAADFLDATQILVRPGVAETQSILARELSSGDDEGARLFRQSNDLTREIEKLRIELAALSRADQTAEVTQRRADLGAEIARLEEEQQLTLVKLADYPQFKAVSSRSLSLADLQDVMLPDEAYVKVSVVGNDVYVFYADKNKATAYRSAMSDAQMTERVDMVRDSISTFNGNNYVTAPFDVETARALYADLLGPVAADLAGTRHIIFEPDGAMLSLPPNLLIADDASVRAYLKRTESIDADLFDFTGIAWLGRDSDVSTAVSARAFYDARRAPLSKAGKQYLGFGQNEAVFGKPEISGVRGTRALQVKEFSPGDSCQWPLGEWNKPISDSELRRAQGILGNNTADVVTGEQFTDDGILARSDLNQYRIVHFATHGLVTAPRPDCPARPALLTSFGGDTSDGLLTFKEIFDLNLDADMVILSACDTAGRATVAATREAGITTGGGSALDGLVRSFIGAGGRSVLASHWPAPDDFDATGKLISGMFEAPAGTSIVDALNEAQRPLMDDPLTSHPYYWAGFAVIGDGRRPFVSGQKRAEAGKNEASSD